MNLQVPRRFALRRHPRQAFVHVENIVAIDQAGVPGTLEQGMEQHEVQISDARLRERRDIRNVFHAKLA